MPDALLPLSLSLSLSLSNSLFLFAPLSSTICISTCDVIELHLLLADEPLLLPLPSFAQESTDSAADPGSL